MNLDKSEKSKTTNISIDDLFDDLDFKPLTSGLGFQKAEQIEVKPIRNQSDTRTPAPVLTRSSFSLENDLSVFYGQGSATEAFIENANLKEEKIYREARRVERFFAYVLDLLFVSSILTLVLSFIAMIIRMDLVDMWSQFPADLTSLVVILFCGFYLLYFSIFEMTSQSTIGKNLFKLQVLTMDNNPLPLLTLLTRSLIGLLNFVSLGLFSYFDLQNKITNSKVIRKD